MCDTIAEAEHLEISAVVVASLKALRDEAANYGSTLTFEFAKRNLAVKKASRGYRLILLDVLFDMERV